MVKEILSFKPKQVAKKLLTGLNDRARDVIVKRYGLEADKIMTLEAVGQIYNITRERVRQIEEFTLNTIKKSDSFNDQGAVFAELKTAMENYGGIVHEREFLEHLSSDRDTQNNIHFLLVLGDAFARLKEDDIFHHRWTVDHRLADAVHASLKNLCTRLSADDLLSEQEMVDQFLGSLHQAIRPEQARGSARQWLSLSKEIGQSPTGEWGLVKSPNVKVRGIRDYAYLVLRQETKPMHFSAVAKAITNQFGRKANAATTHNELIKDNRFILVGRGIYALRDWGYRPGVTRDIIRQVLKDKGPLSKDEVVSHVAKERLVKANTILVNLKNPRYFKQDKEGRFVAL